MAEENRVTSTFHGFERARRGRVGYRSRWEYVGWIIVIPLTGLLGWSVSTNPHFEWHVVAQYLTADAILHGVWLTVLLTAIAMGAGTVIGIALAMMNYSTSKLLSGLAAAYIWFFRGTPLLVQLIFWFNLAALYPTLDLGSRHIDVNQLITPLFAAVLGLGLNEAAYMAEVIRGGLSSVGSGQVEAAESLGLRPYQVMSRVVLPQALRVIVPIWGNQTIAMLKNTSLVSVLGLSELLHSAQIIYGRTFQTIPLLVVACLWYLAMTTVLTAGQWLLERSLDGRRPSRADAATGTPEQAPDPPVNASAEYLTTLRSD